MSDNHPETVLEAVQELANWLVCAGIATPEDMAQSFAYMYATAEWAANEMRKPIDMVLHCPACGLQHIDEPKVEAKVFACHHSDPMTCSCDNSRWTNPPHRSHLCRGCDHIWRPADVPTNGVLAVKTKGKNDSEVES